MQGLRCGGSGICEHGRQRSRRKECGGSGICEHGRRRSICTESGGSGLCEHGRRRSICTECGGSGICEHGRERSRCKECGGGGHVTFLESTEVEEFDGEDDLEECVPTVQARVVGRWLVGREVVSASGSVGSPKCA